MNLAGKIVSTVGMAAIVYGTYRADSLLGRARNLLREQIIEANSTTDAVLEGWTSLLNASMANDLINIIATSASSMCMIEGLQWLVRTVGAGLVVGLFVNAYCRED
jgi:hypothetical protein